MEDPCLKSTLKGHKRTVTDVTFYPENSRFVQFVTSSEDEDLMLWNTDAYSYVFKGHTAAVTGVDFSPNGSLLASVSGDKTIRLWVPKIKGGTSFCRGHTSTINSVAFSPSNTNIISTSNDKSIKMWNIAQKPQFVCSFTGHHNWVRHAQYSPSGNFIVSCADDRTMKIWDTNSCQCQSTITSKTIPLRVAIHRNGNSVAAAMNLGHINIYDVRTNKLQQTYKLHEGKANCVSWHPSANYLLSCGDDGKMNIIDVVEARPLYTLDGHTGPITTAKFNIDGSYFVSGGKDTWVMVWLTNFV